MKILKKSLVVVLCLMMLASAMVNDGWLILIEPVISSALAGHEQAYNDTRIELDFNKDWRFSFTDDDAAYLKGFDDSDWETVNLPHDFSMSQEFTTEGETEAENGQLPGGTGWYRKWFNLYEYYSGDRVILNFDGAYQHTYVYVNGQYVGENHYGYNSFSFEISDYLITTNTVQNLIAVKVVNELPSSRWYSGSGINRDVTLTIAGPVHVSLYGPRITTPDLHTAEKAHANAKIKMHNDTAISKIVNVEATVLDKDHNPVSETVSSGPVIIPANTEKEVTLAPEVKAPEEWSPENPALYKLRTVVKDNETGEIIDEYHTTFGFRCIEWDADSGFMINHKPVKLKGVCLHHDQGALGAAQEYDAIYRQLKILKDMGCNAIRTSHNTASRVFLELCNEMGFLVIEEFFDGWDAPKNGNTHDFSEYFNENLTEDNTAIGANGQKWYEYVIEHTIYRDEHDPCIIAWSVGNELTTGIYGDDATADYAEILSGIIDTVKDIDTSRPVLQGSNAPNDSVLKMIDEEMDVIGGNYNPYTWEQVMENTSDSRYGKPFVATEAASATSTRGVYNTMGHYDFACSAYDTDAVSWGGTAAQAWYYVATNDWFSGEFVWTGFDYIGEPTHWNLGAGDNADAVPNSSYFGIVDTAGFEKDTYYLYRSLWNEKDTTLHLVPGSWNLDSLYNENGFVNVAVYSNAAKIELLLDGIVIGTAYSEAVTTPAGYTYRTWSEASANTSVCRTDEFYTKEGSNFYAQFRVKYASATLSVKAYDENNNEITDTVGSNKSVPGTATQIVASTWMGKNTFVADSADYIYVEFEARDDDGNFMSDYNGVLSFKVDDSSARYAKIVGVDNGNPATTEKYQQDSVLISDSEAEIQMFNGRALVILRTTDEEGTINFTASAVENGTSISVDGVTVTSVSQSGTDLTDELDEVITQNTAPYAPTLYDEFEVVKHHINKLEKPAGGSTSQPDNDDPAAVPEKYDIYLAESKAEGCVPDGKYVIFNQNWVMSANQHYEYAVAGDYQFTEQVSASGKAYPYESFDTSATNVFKFTHVGNNEYYIQNVSTGKYLYKGGYTPYGLNSIIYSDTPHGIYISANADGSVLMYLSDNYLVHYYNTNHFYGEGGIISPETNANFKMWLYEPTGQSDSSSAPVEPDENVNYEILDAAALSLQSIPDGDYVVYNDEYVLAGRMHQTWSMATDKQITDKVAAEAGKAYTYASFNVSAEHIYTFTYQGNNTYYIMHKNSGKYLYIARDYADLRTTPQALQIHINDDGSVLIYCGSEFLVHYYQEVYMYGAQSYVDSAKLYDIFKMWLYTAPVKQVEDAFVRYSATTDTAAPVADGRYVICNINTNGTNTVSSIKLVGGSAAQSDSTYGLGTEDIAEVISDDYGVISSASAENIYTFTSRGNGRYYIQNHEGKYISINSRNNVTLVDTPVELCVARVNNDGDIAIYNPSNMMFLDFFISNVKFFSAWEGSLSDVSENRRFRLYSASAGDNTGSGGNTSGGVTGGTDSYEKLELYNALHTGISEDYTIYTRESFENLLRCLEDGVQIFLDESADSSDYAAATATINAAIAALKIDIKKINGTLFKYGYDNTTGTADYSDGGILMNTIAVKQMKEAILADANLVNQIKQVIAYDDTAFWGEGGADEALDKVAEAYAKIYTLQFTGTPYNGSSVTNQANKTEDMSYQGATDVPLSLWNLWTKDGTHGEKDPEGLHDGASVQGLASATLEKDVIVSHSAYNNALPYSNNGPDNSHDIDKYSYSFTVGQTWRSFTLEPLEGISVYFPDYFTRENIDADGNVTDATSGRFAKYYWDAEFPIFISTDEYGVNTYHFDSKDTTYLVQSEFNDADQTVEMELNEVGSWAASGSHSGSGFFPFNYKQGTTTYTGENAIYHYGFTFEHNFYIPKGGKHINGDDVIFNFSGDDDVYVYIDGVLVLDNGGLHGAREVTVNFTDCTINYQYAMDVTDGILKGDEYEVTYSYNAIVEDREEAASYNADTVAALNKLHEVINDGQVHTLNFFYLERGASDSNCRISFNLSETSEEVRIIDQVLTLDYALPVEYNITENNDISQAAIDNGVTIEYLGLCAVNEDVDNTYTFELPKIEVPFEEGVTYTVDGMKYGICTIDKSGNATYTLTSTNMSESEHFYVCAKITGDPTYSDDVVYYQIEKTTFVPATAIYYEDSFETLTYTDGKVPEGYNNTQNQYGVWKTEGTQLTTLKQTADLTDSEANPYGYEENYLSFSEFSGGSLHFVNVSQKNNPNSKYSGGDGAQWPTVDFTFTGTGFDLISVTDSTSGAFSVTIKDTDGKTVKTAVVDTYYGYNYGQLYSDANGKPTLDSSGTVMYRSEKGSCTSSKRYYDENGAVTDVPHYMYGDEIVEWDTGTPAYAYAYGWVIAEGENSARLYQIPVIKITDLTYGTYDVTITPTFTSMFKHSLTAADGTKYYSVYLDAIKIYSPAGEGDNIKDDATKDAYATDDELYPSYLELKNMLIGADSLSGEGAQGVIFIDGIAALDNDLETYKNAGPNNELYLAKDQAVAFEIWATAVPTDIQLGVKLACGNPKLTVSYAARTSETEIKTATDIYYSLNTIMPNDGKLTWRQIEAPDGNYYYTTGTVVIQNTGEEDSVLSVTNLKWTFSQYGGKGHYRIPDAELDDVLMLSVTPETQPAAYSLMRMRTAALDVTPVNQPTVATDAEGNSLITIRLNTSTDVESLVITDENGNPIDMQDVEYLSEYLEDEGIIEWTVTLRAREEGTFTYIVSGVYSNGYADYSGAAEITVTVKAPEEDTSDEGNPDDEADDGSADGTIFDTLTGMYKKLIEFIRAILALFGVLL